MMPLMSFITDRKEVVNQYMGNVSLCSVEVIQADFKEWIESSDNFEPQILEIFGEKRKVARDCVVSVLKHMINVYNSNILRYADGIIVKIDIDPEIRKKKTKVDGEKFKTSY